MYQTNKLFVTANESVSDIIIENPSLLIMLEHFEIPCVVHENTVEQLCDTYKVPQKLFVLFANLYNGFMPSKLPDFTLQEISWIIRFLANSHIYYKTDKYPEIQAYISQLIELNTSPEIRLVKKFFEEYFVEVIEHLDYENKIAFPFFESFIQQSQHQLLTGFSAEEYRNHHTDIEYKLIELKHLLLKHIELQNDAVVRRKLLQSLFELEYDLKIHSIIEETILTPVIKHIEKQKK